MSHSLECLLAKFGIISFIYIRELIVGTWSADIDLYSRRKNYHPRHYERC